MKLAYFGYPHHGGTFSVYRQLRAGLSRVGHEVSWVGIGPEAERAAADPAWSEHRDSGFALPHRARDERDLAAAFVDAIEQNGFDGVFVNVLADRVQTNAVRYLRPGILRIMIVHNITPGTYAAARAIRDHVHATVGVSPRIRDELIRRYGFDRHWTMAIPNSTDVSPVERRAARSDAGALRLLFLGRIDDQPKGVFWLPEILRHLPREVTLTIAGDGPDLPRLSALCTSQADRIRFVGPVSRDQAAALLRQHDVLVAPSRYEGFLIVLAEAMAEGCVPVASLIRGVTDYVIDHGADGLLFPVGDTGRAARMILDLHRDRARLDRMAAAGIATARRRFMPDAMGVRYAGVIRALTAGPPAIAPPLRIEDWRMAPGLNAGIRTYLPRPVKNLLRTMKERLAS